MLLFYLNIRIPRMLKMCFSACSLGIFFSKNDFCLFEAMISSFNADLSDCLVKLRNADKLHKKFLSIFLSIRDGGIITSFFYWFLVFGFW